MPYVLIIITVFTTTQGIASDTRFGEFDNRAACEAARADVERNVRSMPGQVGREVVAACYAKGGKKDPLRSE